jgi:hypothetical protein
MKTIIAATILALASTTVLAQQPRGGMDQLSFEQLLNIADKDKNKAVTKQEFLDAMGKVYDMKMEKFKGAKDTKMMQGDGLTREGVKSLIEDIYRGA